MQFVGAGDTLTLSQPGDIGPITGFAATDTIDLANFDLLSETVTVSGGNTLVSVTGTDNGQTITENLTFVGAQYGDAIQFNDPNGATLIATDAACFCRGTLIRTPEGDAAVETLLRGDFVMTVAGEAKPISWIGLRTVRRVSPIRSAAGRSGSRPARSAKCAGARSLALARPRFACRWRADPRGRAGQRDVDPA